MGRYRKVVLNEVELKEIGGQTPLIKPSVEDKFRALEIFKKMSMDKVIDLSEIRVYLTELLFKSIHIFKDGKPTSQIIESETDTTKTDIDAYVVENLFELWTETVIELGIVDRDKAESVKKKAEEETKKKLQI